MDKFNLLVFMTQKLFAFIQGKCCEEGADAIMMQEVLTGGSIYQQVGKIFLLVFAVYLYKRCYFHCRENTLQVKLMNRKAVS